MESREPTHLRLKVSAKVAPIVAGEAPRDLQMSAAQGALSLPAKDLLTVLFLFCGGKDEELRRTAAETVRNLSPAFIEPVLEMPDLDPHLLDLVARLRGNDRGLAGQVINHPQVREATLCHLARSASAPILELLLTCRGTLERSPQLVEAMMTNPHATEALKSKLGAVNLALADPEKASAAWKEASQTADRGQDADDAFEGEELGAEIEEDNVSKYQLSLNLSVTEKIKMGMTGDKEWRGLLIKDANKLVQGAVMKNPRITEPEVIAIARNKQSSDEMIRMILLNKDWLKLYELKRALVWHPKTPLPKALRMIPFLTLRDLKEIARSRNVQTVLSTAARKAIELKQKKA